VPFQYLGRPYILYRRRFPNRIAAGVDAGAPPSATRSRS